MIRDDINNVVIDTTTNLMWHDDYYYVQAQLKTWNEAINYCENDLNASGYTDWRLPNINELYTIIDTATYEPAIHEIFKYTANKRYWSSTTSVTAITPTYKIAWAIDFNTSKTYQGENKANTLNLRCVRTY